MPRRYCWMGFLALCVGFTLTTALSVARSAAAQTPSSLDDQTLLSLVIPPLADGSRPGVHMWARADQFNGPGGLPTVFIVTLYPRQTNAGSEEREIVNYVQYSGGAWAAARPRDPGTLLVSDWAWLSQNLTNLTANAGGTGSSSQYTVDYSSSGHYAGSPRVLDLEEIYAADLSLTSSTVLTDSSGSSAAVSAPAAQTVTATPGLARATATAAPGTASGSPTPVRPAASATPVSSNTINLGTPIP